VVLTVTIPLAHLDEFERVQGSVEFVDELGLNRSGETVDRNRGERVLGEEATGCEARRGNDDDGCSINAVESDLGISVLESSRVQFINGKEEASLPVFDIRLRRLEMTSGHN
jgi:hypothetical protein